MEEQDGRRRRQQEQISILYWFVRTRNSLSPSHSRSFRTQSHWSFTSGQCIDSERFLRVDLSHRMCNQFTFHHEFKIFSGRTKFEQKTDGILYSLWIPCIRTIQTQWSLIWPNHVLHLTSKTKVDSAPRYGVLGRYTACSTSRIEVLSNKFERGHPLWYTPSLLYLESNCDEIWRNHISERLDAIYIPDYGIKKGASMVLDTARPKYQENTIWFGMRGRDAARKSTPNVNILQVFTIDFSQIQFIMNHNSQPDGQNKSAKSGMNLRKKTIHMNSLQRKDEDTKDNGILLQTKQAKMGLWNFDLIAEPLSWWKIAYTTNQENQLKSLSVQFNKDEYKKDKKFSPKITSPAPELTNTQDGNTGLHLQVFRGGTHLNGVGSELTFFFAEIAFCYSWFRMKLIAIHCNRRVVWTEHPHTRLFLDTFTLVHTSHCGSRCRSTCLHKTCSSTCYHMSEGLLFPCFVFFLCLSCLCVPSHFSLFSVLNFNSHNVENAEHFSQCAPEKWGVLHRGDIQPSHKRRSMKKIGRNIGRKWGKLLWWGSERKRVSTRISLSKRVRTRVTWKEIVWRESKTEREEWRKQQKVVKEWGEQAQSWAWRGEDGAKGAKWGREPISEMKIQRMKR